MAEHNGEDDDEFDELFSFGNTPDRAARKPIIRDDNDDDDIFGTTTTTESSSSGAAAATVTTRPTPSKSASAVPSVEQVLGMLPTTETVPPTPPTTAKKTSTSEVPSSSMPRVPILDGDEDEDDVDAAAEDLVVVQSSEPETPATTKGEDRSDMAVGVGVGVVGRSDDDDDFHVHDSGTRDFLDWLDGDGDAPPTSPRQRAGGGVGGTVSSPPAAPATVGSPTSPGSDGLGGLLDTPKQRGERAKVLSPSGDGGGDREMRTVDSFDFEKEIWGSAGGGSPGGGGTSPGTAVETASAGSPSSPLFSPGKGRPDSSSPEGAAATTKASESPSVPPPDVPVVPAVEDERGIMSITSDDSEDRTAAAAATSGGGGGGGGEGGTEGGDVVAIPPPPPAVAATEEYTGSISSFEPISAPSSAPNSENGQDVHHHPVMVFRDEAADAAPPTPAPAPAQTAAILRSDSEEPTGGHAADGAADDAGEISPPPPPPQPAQQGVGIFRGTSTTDEEFRAILPTLNDDGDELEGEGGIPGAPPPLERTPSSPTIAALSFSSLRQALDSPRSMPSHIRHFVSSDPLSAGSSRKCDVWDLLVEDRSRLYVKLICRKTYKEVEGSSLAGTYEEWAKENVLEAAEGRDGGECWAREEARRLTRDLLAAGHVDSVAEQEFEANLRSVLLFHGRSHRGVGGGRSRQDQDGGGDDEPESESSSPTPMIPGFIPPSAAVLLSSVRSPPVASVTLSRLASSSALMPLAALGPEEQLAAARSLHERFYLLCAYHLPLVVLHLDRHLPGWYWPFCGEMPEPDIAVVGGGEREREGEEKTHDDVGGDLLLTEEKGEEGASEKEEQKRQTTVDDCRHPERNGLIPLCWFVSAFAGSSVIPSPDGRDDEGGVVDEWRGGLPPRYLSRLWDVLLLDSGDGRRNAGWCGARKFFLALAVLERHSHRMLLIRDRDELERYLRDAVLLSGVGAAGGGGGGGGVDGIDGPHGGGADVDDDEDSSLGVVVVGGSGGGDPEDRPPPAAATADDAEVRRHVAAWFEAASTLRESTPRSVLDQLRTAEDDTVNSVLLARQRRTDRLLRLKLEEEARRHREAEERRVEVRRRLMKYYRKYNPEKTEDAAMDRIMEVYEGRWDVLDAKLKKKYGTGYLDASFSPTKPEESSSTGDREQMTGPPVDGGDDTSGVTGTSTTATEEEETGTNTSHPPPPGGRLKRNLSTEANKIFAMAKRIDLAQAKNSTRLWTPPGLVTSFSQDSSDGMPAATADGNLSPRVFVEGQQEQVAVQVLAEEIVPVICAKHMTDQQGATQKTTATTTPHLDEGFGGGIMPLRYFLIDSRPTNRVQAQGRLPTAVHISPESLLDPELIQTELDMFESLRGSVHICVMGEGISAIPRLYGYDLRESEKKAAQEDDSRTGICALFFIKMGFPFVSILDGGFGAAHSWLSREGPSHSLQPTQVLVDYDENGSMWAKLERTHRLKSQGISPAIQDFVDTSMAKLTVGKSRIENFASENLDREGRQRVKESVTRLIHDVRTQSTKRSSPKTADDDVISENTGENQGNRFKLPPIRRGFGAGTRGSPPPKDKGTVVGPQAEEQPSLATEGADERSGDKSVAEDAPLPSKSTTTLRKNPFAGLGNKIAAQRALHVEHAKKSAASDVAAEKKGDSAENDGSEGAKGDHPVVRNRFGGIGAKLAMRRKVGTADDNKVVGETVPMPLNEQPSDQLTAEKKNAGGSNFATTNSTESVAPDPSALFGNTGNEEGSEPPPGVGMLRRNPFGGLMNRPVRSTAENDMTGGLPTERSEAEETCLTSADEEHVTSTAAGRAVVADMFKKTPFGRLGNRAPGQSGDSGVADDGPNIKNRVEVLKVNPFARFGSKGLKKSAEHEFSASEESISFETGVDDDVGRFSHPTDDQALSPSAINTSLRGMLSVGNVSSREMSKGSVSQGNSNQNTSVQENVALDPPSKSSMALFPVQEPALASPVVSDMLDIAELSIEDDKTIDPTNV